jgi:hypothetical protein
MLASLRYGQSSPALWEALSLSGAAGFGTAVGIHPMIGYLSVAHLGPAVAAASCSPRVWRSSGLKAGRCTDKSAPTTVSG